MKWVEFLLELPNIDLWNCFDHNKTMFESVIHYFQAVFHIMKQTYSIPFSDGWYVFFPQTNNPINFLSTCQCLPIHSIWVWANLNPFTKINPLYIIRHLDSISFNIPSNFTLIFESKFRISRTKYLIVLKYDGCFMYECEHMRVNVCEVGQFTDGAEHIFCKSTGKYEHIKRHNEQPRQSTCN